MPALQQRTTKKRTAPTSQDGPKSKKLKATSSKPKSSASDADHVKESGKKRSRPVTASVVAEKDEEESDYEDEDAGDDFLDEGGDGDAMDVTEDQVASKDPNASRESHKAQRALAQQRRASKPHSALLTSAKQIWSQARLKPPAITPAERTKHVNELMDVLRGHVKDVVLKHDASRIIQTLVKYGSKKQREEIATELKGSFRDLAQNRYSKFLVTKLIRLCPGQRASILSEFQGHVLKLLLHREASSVLADSFELYANAYERSILLRDFYGKEVALFSKIDSGDAPAKERAKAGLVGIVQDMDVERRKRTVNAVKENLETIFNNPDKGAVTHAIVHRALWEYLAALPKGEEGEKTRREMFECCQEILAEMVHTKDGSRAVREFLAYGTAKDRKHITKVLKPHVERMATDDEAQLVLFTALDVIDDTKMSAKSLVSPITTTTSTLVASPQGRRTLLYLLVPRSRRHFTPAQTAVLAETDKVRDGVEGKREGTSKKDAAVRATEVRQAASPDLIEWVRTDGPSAVRETGGSLVVGDIMLFAEGDKTAASKALLEPVGASYPSSTGDGPEDETSLHAIQLPHTSRTYKTLLQGGHFSHATKTIERAPHFSAEKFAEEFVKVVGQDKENALRIAKGDGAFVFAELLERVREEADSEVKKTVKGWFKDGKWNEKEDGEGRGHVVLKEKVDALLAS